jgi:UPF0755 protein
LAIRRSAAAGLSLCLIALIGLGFFWWAWAGVNGVGPSTQETRVLIPRGAGLETIGQRLEESGVISHRLFFIAGAVLTGRQRPVKFGEYLFPPGVSVRSLLEQMRDGRVVVRKLTVPEGLTVAQVFELVSKAEGLSGALPSPVAEGSLLPETYNYSWGDGRAELIARMSKAMEDALADAWSNRTPGLPLNAPKDLATLASIIERETGQAVERPRVAAVFVNRLRKGMRLQSDPTVIYGITNGAAPFERALTRADLERPTAYNSYTNFGLPPGPIANPGRASLQAASQPGNFEDLYFVADGSGGHAFAQNLEQHNRNVARWRRLQQERGRTP